MQLNAEWFVIRELFLEVKEHFISVLPFNGKGCIIMVLSGCVPLCLSFLSILTIILIIHRDLHCRNPDFFLTS